MNLQDVDYINAICSHGSFVRAAKELGITQPTLSARIERIEKKISGQLFERGKGHSKPTNLAKLVGLECPLPRSNNCPLIFFSILSILALNVG